MCCRRAVSAGSTWHPVPVAHAGEFAGPDVLDSAPRRHAEKQVNRLDIQEVIREQIEKNPVILYMKGSPQFPQCGFSARAVEALTHVGKPFAYVNVLEAPEIRSGLPQYGNWPTFPQLWVSGELLGGSDIILEMLQSGELAEMLEAVAVEAAPSDDTPS